MFFDKNILTIGFSCAIMSSRGVFLKNAKYYFSRRTFILNRKTVFLSNRISSIISLVLAILLIPALLFILWWLPDIVTAMLDTHDNLGNREAMQAWERTGVLIAAYAMIAVAFAAVGLLLALLHTVLTKKVFSEVALRVLNWLAVCCFVEGVLFCYVGIYFQVAFCLMIAAFFLGVSLRVVHNVIAEAMRYKEENELTV